MGYCRKLIISKVGCNHLRVAEKHEKEKHVPFSKPSPYEDWQKESFKFDFVKYNP